MSLVKLEFDNEDDYRIARDIHLEILEAEGWKPRPDLDMWIQGERAAIVRERLDAKGVTYRAAAEI